MRKISLNQINELFSLLASKMDLYIPADNKAGRAEFTKWEEGLALSRSLNTEKGPKELFFPQAENLMEFKAEGKSIEIIDTFQGKNDFIVFGVRACDVKGLEVLDKVFLSEPYDSYYANAREHGIIMALSCEEPLETCFCTTFNIDPIEPYADVSMWKTNDSLYLKANTSKGESVLKIIENLTTVCHENELTELKERARSIFKMLPLASLSLEKFGGGKTKELFDSPLWTELSEACLGCGTCTFVCPTCQCYDIKDFNTGSGVVRYRCWDSCMYSEFTKMAHGNNRVTQKERFRQRFMHKLVYFPENNDGMFSCVGCGRCLMRCPISMNIAKVIKRFNEVENEQK